MALITVADLTPWTDQEISTARQDEANRCCVAAQSWVEGRTGRTLEVGAAVTRYFDGSDAGGRYGDELWLPAEDRPVIHSGGDLLTVTEDGAAVTVAVGYSTSAGAILKGANADRRGCLVRRDQAWASGVQNIAVVYKLGWSTTTLPARVKELLLELALLFFREPQWIGKASVSKAGGAVTIMRELSPGAQGVLESLRVR